MLITSNLLYCPSFCSVWINSYITGYDHECGMLLWLLFCSFVVFVVGADPFVARMSTEFRNTLKNETHFSSISICTSYLGAGIAQLVSRLATSWTDRGSHHVGSEIFRIHPDRPWGSPSLLYNGNRVFPGCKKAVAWRWSPTVSNAEVKERVELYLRLWALVSCYRVKFAFVFLPLRNQWIQCLFLEGKTASAWH